MQAAVAQDIVKKKSGGQLFAAINAPNQKIAEFKRLVNNTAALFWAQDDIGVYTESFGNSPICQGKVKQVVKASPNFEAYFEGPQGPQWERALHGQLKG